MTNPGLGWQWLPVVLAGVVVLVGWPLARRLRGEAFDRRWRLAEVLTVSGVLSILLGLAEAATRLADGSTIGSAPGWPIFAGCLWLVLGLPLFRRRTI